MTNFTAAFDPGYETWIVISTETRAYSFAMVPASAQWEYATKAEALEQAKRLSGKLVQTRMIETPNRFEAVADTVYGAEWGVA